MAHMIPLPPANEYTPIPEGVTIFKITNVDFNEKTGRLEFTLTTKSGKNHIEKFALKKDGKSYNEKALKALGYFSRTALNNWDIDNVDPETLVGHFIKATVEHETLPHRDDPTKTVTFIHLGDKKPAECYEDGTTEPKGGSPKPTPVETADEPETDELDLDDLLADL